MLTGRRDQVIRRRYQTGYNVSIRVLSSHSIAPNYRKPMTISPIDGPTRLPRVSRDVSRLVPSRPDWRAQFFCFLLFLSLSNTAELLVDGSK